MPLTTAITACPIAKSGSASWRRQCSTTVSTISIILIAAKPSAKLAKPGSTVTIALGCPVTVPLTDAASTILLSSSNAGLAAAIIRCLTAPTDQSGPAAALAILLAGPIWLGTILTTPVVYDELPTIPSVDVLGSSRCYATISGSILAVDATSLSSVLAANVGLLAPINVADAITVQD